MSFNIFIVLCVLGCDVLIYVLYQWVLGEKRRARLHREVSRQRAEAAQRTQPFLAATQNRGAGARAVIPMDRKEPKAPNADGLAKKYSEELVYRRLAAWFANPKPRT